jgi:hypothetical protein
MSHTHFATDARLSYWLVHATVRLRVGKIGIWGSSGLPDKESASERRNQMHTELVTHTCGHNRTYSRPSAEVLKFIAEYAKTTLCWDCWKLARTKGER